MKCPECGYCFQNPIMVCKNLIAKGKKKESVRSSKKAIDNKKEVYVMLKTFCSNEINKGSKVSTNYFLEKYDLLGRTEGDTIRLMLDLLVCEGYLTKISFNCASGHKYLVNEKIIECSLCFKGDLFPICIGKDEHFTELGDRGKGVDDE
jgi:hypothetical protein